MDKPPEKPNVIDFAEAKKKLDQGGKKNNKETKTITPEEMEQAGTLYDQGLEFEQIENSQEQAISCYKKALELNPKFTAVAVHLGNMYFEKNQFGYAENSYRQATENDPAYPLPWFNLGNLYDQIGRKSEAINSYKKAMELDPTYGDPIFNLAILYEKNDDVMTAFSTYKKYLKIPGIPNIYREKALHRISEIREKLIAKTEYQKVAEDLGHNIGSFNLVERKKEAQKYYNWALGAKSDGFIDQAIAFCETALIYNPKLEEASELVTALRKQLLEK